jgi:hypothetical protein
MGVAVCCQGYTELRFLVSGSRCQTQGHGTAVNVGSGWIDSRVNLGLLVLAGQAREMSPQGEWIRGKTIVKLAWVI